MKLEAVDASALQAHRDGVAALVRDAVESGSSIGFVLPFADGELDAYVDEVVDEVAGGRRTVLLAVDDGLVAGMVQLVPSPKANGRHRAEVQKLIVHTSRRRQGLARRLLDAVEAVARADGRTLLVLDTEVASAADSLYRSAGYVEAGVIPDYAARADGGLIATRVFFKRLA